MLQLNSMLIPFSIHDSQNRTKKNNTFVPNSDLKRMIANITHSHLHIDSRMLVVFVVVICIHAPRPDPSELLAFSNFRRGKNDVHSPH